MAQAYEPRDLELIRWLAAGDEAAFVSFYSRHQAAIYRFALHMTGKPQTAADVVQETFIALMRDAGRFNASRGTPAAFLFGIARNHIHRIFEKESRFVPLSEMHTEAGSRNGNGHVNGNGNGAHAAARVAEFSSAGDASTQSAAVAELRAAILSLPEHYREVVTLCDLEGKSYEEASSLLDCPIGTIRSRLNRARDLLLVKLRPRVVAQADASVAAAGVKAVRGSGR